MAYFPFFMNMEKMKGLVVGGGKVASRKVMQLLPYGPVLHVVTPEISTEIHEFATDLRNNGRIRVSTRPFKISDLDQIDFVVAASCDSQLNAEISRMCKERRIPVNVVDVKEECSFIFPSLIKEGAISVGISTGGNSPWMAKYLKKKVRDAIPEGFGEMSEELGRWRAYVKEKVSAQYQRETIFIAMAETILAKGENQRFFTEEEIDDFIAQVCLNDCSDTRRTE